MPRGDRTGPMGQGPRTGRAVGLCEGYDAPGYMNAGRGFGGGRGRRGGRGRGFGGGRGRGFGSGRGRGFGAWWVSDAPPALSREDEVSMLRRSAEAVQAELDAINRRIGALTDETGDEA